MKTDNLHIEFLQTLKKEGEHANTLRTWTNDTYKVVTGADVNLDTIATIKSNLEQTRKSDAYLNLCSNRRSAIVFNDMQNHAVNTFYLDVEMRDAVRTLVTNPILDEIPNRIPVDQAAGKLADDISDIIGKLVVKSDKEVREKLDFPQICKDLNALESATEVRKAQATVTNTQQKLGALSADFQAKVNSITKEKSRTQWKTFLKHEIEAREGLFSQAMLEGRISLMQSIAALAEINATLKLMHIQGMDILTDADEAELTSINKEITNRLNTKVTEYASSVEKLKDLAWVRTRDLYAKIDIAQKKQEAEKTTLAPAIAQLRKSFLAEVPNAMGRLAVPTFATLEEYFSYDNKLQGMEASLTIILMQRGAKP